MIILKDLEFHYNIKNFKIEIPSLIINKGETVCFCGPNGSGKTTILKILAGLLPVNKGCLENHFKISFVHQNPYLFNDTVYKNISLGLTKLDKNLLEKQIENIADILNIRHLLYKKAKNLSIGETKLVCLAQQFVLNRDIIILDEPIEGIDKERKVKIENFLYKLKEQKFTIIFSSHEMNLAYKIADRIFNMENGRIFESGLINFFHAKVLNLQSHSAT